MSHEKDYYCSNIVIGMVHQAGKLFSAFQNEERMWFSIMNSEDYIILREVSWPRNQSRYLD